MSALIGEPPFGVGSEGGIGLGAVESRFQPPAGTVEADAGGGGRAADDRGQLLVAKALPGGQKEDLAVGLWEALEGRADI